MSVKTVYTVVLFLVALGFTLQAKTLQAATVNVACPGQTIQAAVDSANAGDTINVTGNCSENVLIRNEKQRITINGGGTGLGGTGGATLTAVSASSPALNVRGKGILIQGFSSISGGSPGVIWVNRGSNAIINSNTIQNSATSRGILISNLGFGAITNNVIQNNATDGIQVSGTSQANIGFNFGSDSSASPNTIANNGDRGIQITQGSSARIMSNTIQNNGTDGIAVFRMSQADIASNTINGNGTAFLPGGTDGNGIAVSQNSVVQLGEDALTTFFELPNTTTVNNANFGIRCTLGGVVRGHLGNSNQINGAVAQLGGGAAPGAFSTNCPNSLEP
jgi:parallel beta-helix repeat protein